jgi:hypothetical protein
MRRDAGASAAARGWRAGLERGEVEPAVTARREFAVEHDVAEPRAEGVDHVRKERGERSQLS